MTNLNLIIVLLQLAVHLLGTPNMTPTQTIQAQSFAGTAVTIAQEVLNPSSSEDIGVQMTAAGNGDGGYIMPTQSSVAAQSPVVTSDDNNQAFGSVVVTTTTLASPHDLDPTWSWSVSTNQENDGLYEPYFTFTGVGDGLHNPVPTVNNITFASATPSYASHDPMQSQWEFQEIASGTYTMVDHVVKGNADAYVTETIIVPEPYGTAGSGY